MKTEKTNSPRLLQFPDRPAVEMIVRENGSDVPEHLLDARPYYLGEEDIPYAHYIDEDFYQLEMEKVWGRVWQWACREEHIPEVGDSYVYEIGKWSILIVRTEAGIKAYYNACLHRGAQFRTGEGESYSPEIRCPYHGWSWSLTGELKSVPCQWDFPQVDCSKLTLPEVKVGTWGGFVFINLGENPEPLEEFLGVIPKHFERWPIHNWHVAAHAQAEVACNWKLFYEPAMEAYHVPELHPQMAPAPNTNAIQYDVYGDHVSRFWTADTGPRSSDGQQRGADLSVQKSETPRMAMARLTRAALAEKYGGDWSKFADTEFNDIAAYNVFPNMLLYYSFTQPQAFRCRPLGIDRMLFEMFIFEPTRAGEMAPPPPVPERIGADQPLTDLKTIDPFMLGVIEQDRSAAVSQQKGMMTSKKTGATPSLYQELRIRHLHKTLKKYVEAK